MRRGFEFELTIPSISFIDSKFAASDKVDNLLEDTSLPRQFDVLQDHAGGQLPFLQLLAPAKEKDPAGQLEQILELGPENVPAAH